MDEKNELERLLDQIAQLVQLAQGKPTGNFPKDIEERLKQIERKVTLLNIANTAFLQTVDLNEDQVKNILASLEGLPDKERHLLERSKKLKGAVDDIQKNLKIATALAKEEEGKEAKKRVARKKKFRSMGGQKGWKPL